MYDLAAWLVAIPALIEHEVVLWANAIVLAAGTALLLAALLYGPRVTPTLL